MYLNRHAKHDLDSFHIARRGQRRSMSSTGRAAPLVFHFDPGLRRRAGWFYRNSQSLVVRAIGQYHGQHQHRSGLCPASSANRRRFVQEITRRWLRRCTPARLRRMTSRHSHCRTVRVTAGSSITPATIQMRPAAPRQVGSQHPSA